MVDAFVGVCVNDKIVRVIAPDTVDVYVEPVEFAIGFLDEDLGIFVVEDVIESGDTGVIDDLVDVFTGDEFVCDDICLDDCGVKELVCVVVTVVLDVEEVDITVLDNLDDFVVKGPFNVVLDVDVGVVVLEYVFRVGLNILAVGKVVAKNNFVYFCVVGSDVFIFEGTVK